MRFWQFWYQTFATSLRQSPPRFIELIMLSLTVALSLTWIFNPHWAYLMLCSSYAVGSAASIWVREALLSPTIERAVQATAVLLLACLFLAVCLYTVMDMTPIRP